MRNAVRSRGFVATGSAVVALLVWQLVAVPANPIILPSPLEVVQAVPVVWQNGLLHAYGGTMKVFLIGVAVSVAFGIIAGIATGLVRSLKNFADPIVLTMYSTPAIVLIPLLTIWFGINDGPTYAIVFLSVFFPVLTNTQLGLNEVEATMVELGKSFGANRREMLWKVLLPGIVPHILAGLRIAAPRGFVAVIAAEMLIAAKNLGGMILLYGNRFQTANYLVPVILVIVTSLIFGELLRYLERRLTPWKARADS